MTNPPTPRGTDSNQHAPGMSQTLEEHAAASESFSNAKRDERVADEAEKKTSEEV